MSMESLPTSDSNLWTNPLPVQFSGTAQSRVVAILGSQWGDEGKGKLVDIFAATADVCCRYNGGANAGHTLVVDGVKYALHLVPCGILYDHTQNLLGNGVVIHIPTLLNELDEVERTKPGAISRIFISTSAHLVLDFHVKVDGLEESAKADDGSQKIGTTKRGIGPCYSNKMARDGLRMGDLLHWDTFVIKYNRLLASHQQRFSFEHDANEELRNLKQALQRLKPQLIDSVAFIQRAIASNKKLLIEGANATFLDVDFGTYPCVTSSSTTAGGVCTGLGIPPSLVRQVVGVVKAYTTRVGEGPFPTELFDDIGAHFQSVGAEFGVTTKRPRRCGWFDVVMVRYSSFVCGYVAINMTKLDVLTGVPTIKLCVAYKSRKSGSLLAPFERPASLEDYEDIEPVYEEMEGWTDDISNVTRWELLPHAARNYVLAIENLVGVPVAWVSSFLFHRSE